MAQFTIIVGDRRNPLLHKQKPTREEASHFLAKAIRDYPHHEVALVENGNVLWWVSAKPE